MSTLSKKIRDILNHQDTHVGYDDALDLCGELEHLESILLRYQRAPVDSSEEQEASDALLAEMERLEKENP